MKISLLNEEVVVKDLLHHTLVGGRFIDEGRRIRLLTGEHTGSVLMHNQFEVVELLKRSSCNTLTDLLATAWKLNEN